MTRNLTELIINQKKDLSGYDADEVTSLKKLKSEKEKSFLAKLEDLKTVMNEKTKKEVCRARWRKKVLVPGVSSGQL